MRNPVPSIVLIMMVAVVVVDFAVGVVVVVVILVVAVAVVVVIFVVLIVEVVVVVVVALGVLVVARYSFTSPPPVTWAPGRPDRSDLGKRREDEEVRHGSYDLTAATWHTAGAGSHRSFRLARTALDVRWTAEKRPGRVSGMGSACGHGRPPHSGSTSGGDRRSATSLTSSSSVVSRNLGSMTVTAPAAHFVAEVHIVVASAVTRMGASRRQRRS